jgi:hypothetical protein
MKDYRPRVIESPDGERSVIRVPAEPRGDASSIDLARQSRHTYVSGHKFSRAYQSSSRPLSRDYELLGLGGEIQAELDFGLSRDSPYSSSGRRWVTPPETRI